jgi:4-amino-4-deoxy-L-arabinose transferase-like glycosyltransferase
MLVRNEDGARRFEPPMSPAFAVGLLVALALPLYFLRLGGPALVDPDEPYYAVPALEMLKAGRWSVPLLHGQPWFDKPILFYWVVLAAYKAFGVSAWAARLGSALAGLGGAVALATLSPARWRRNGAHVLAAIVLATSLEYAFLSRSAVTDMTLTLFMTLGFLAVARYLESGGAWAAASAGAAFGLATLTKGPIGAVIPAIALLGYGLAARRREHLSVKAIGAAAGGFVAMAAPWYGYMLVAHRELVVDVFLGQENLGRFVNPEHRQVPLFYVAVLAAGLLPWSAALPAALTDAIRAVGRGDDRAPASPGPMFALAWFGGVVGVFSLSASKLMTYVLPAFPPAAFLIADYWCRAVPWSSTGERLPRGPRIVAWSGAAILLAVAAGLLVFARGGRYADLGPGLQALAAVLAAAAIAAAVTVRSSRLAGFVAAQVASTIAVVLVVVVFAWPRFESWISTQEFVSRLSAEGFADQVAGAYRVHDLSLDFYMGRSLSRENDPAELARRVRDDPGRLWVLRTADVGGIMALLPLDVAPVLTVTRCTLARLSPGRARSGRKEGS